MHKLIALYREPPDVAAFERHYAEVHLPLVRKIPGLTRIVLNRGIAPPWGGTIDYYLIVEMHFPDEATFRSAMASPENRATGKDLRSFAGSIVSLAVVHEADAT
jgi:uncharacterized protein (TIGR02118 family)